LEKALARHSTLNCLELGGQGGDGRYKKVLAKPELIKALLLEEGVKSIPRRSREIVLDFDATDDSAVDTVSRYQAGRECWHRGGVKKDRAEHQAAFREKGPHHREG
jgi:hypothetical protein